MKKFEPAEFEIIRFNISDVVTTSGGLSDGGAGDGDGEDDNDLWGTLE